MVLRLGDEAPNFKAQTTEGEIDFHEFIGNSWVVLFSHPADFKLGEVARRSKEFEERNVKVIGLSANELGDHHKWVKDINEVNKVNVGFPIIADADRTVSTKYDMLDYQDATNVDTKGRNFDEIIRVIDSLQLGDKHRITTPANWKKGDDVIIHPGVTNEDAEKLFPGYKAPLPYLRLAKSPF
ncbi:20414_t:CDS:2 [Gigaspora margarita]|uniref:20414_t:CDS:1 n=1 Tax=Gigaspora margarita TaxID=4874 RepID=A0ABN7W3Y6_GIGMA|nr:20414_t:CDS:2 [Gigaspora margarita]